MTLDYLHLIYQNYITKLGHDEELLSERKRGANRSLGTYGGKIGRKMEPISVELILCARCSPGLHKQSHLNLINAL